MDNVGQPPMTDPHANLPAWAQEAGKRAEMVDKEGFAVPTQWNYHYSRDVTRILEAWAEDRVKLADEMVRTEGLQTKLEQVVVLLRRVNGGAYAYPDPLWDAIKLFLREEDARE